MKKHFSQIASRIDAYNLGHEKKLVYNGSKSYNRGKPYYTVIEYKFGDRTLHAVAMRTGVYLMIETATNTTEYLDEFLETLH